MKTMLNYVGQFFEISIVYHTLYLWNEDSDPHFFAFLAQVTHYLPTVNTLKKFYGLENYRANA